MHFLLCARSFGDETGKKPCDSKVYVYLTSEMTLEPGLLVLLYKTRWEIEKVFDETKTKLQEQKILGDERHGQGHAGAFRGHRSQSAAAGAGPP
jgi:hypothetical protein